MAPKCLKPCPYSKSVLYNWPKNLDTLFFTLQNVPQNVHIELKTTLHSNNFSFFKFFNNSYNLVGVRLWVAVCGRYNSIMYTVYFYWVDNIGNIFLWGKYARNGMRFIFFWVSKGLEGLHIDTGKSRIRS